MTSRKNKAVRVVTRYGIQSPLIRPLDVPNPVAKLALRKARKLSSDIDRRALRVGRTMLGVVMGLLREELRKPSAEAVETRAVLADSHRRELEDAKQTAFINGKALWLSRFELRRTRSIGRAWMTACLITWAALVLTLLV